MGELRLIANRFQVGELIGQGGMGDVYRGVDTQSGETVAIKALRSEIVHTNPALVERFTREAEALRQLNHPSIVKVLASIEEDTHRYIVLEYVGGGSLADLLREQPQLPVRRVVNICLDLADALTRAHRLHIIHRDIKPGNVLMAEDGTPRLTDFGVAHLDDRSRVTETGTMIGTYAYLSPEAAYGQELDERADIWAFGILLFEMLAGKRPFDEGRPAATLTAIIAKPLPNLLDLRPDTPPALLALVNAMLTKDRDQRIGSVRLVGAELESILRDLDTPSRPVPSSVLPVGTNISRFNTPTPHTESPAIPTGVGTPAGADVPPPSFAYSSIPAPIETAAAPPPGTPTPAESVAGPRTSAFSPIAIAQTETGERFVILRSRPILWLVGGLLLVLLVLILVLGQPSSPPDDDAAGGTPIQAVEPVQPGEYMVLVADLEPLNVEPRDEVRFILENLHERLEIEVPFSKIRVRAYPGLITSGEQAQAVAEAAGATVIVWGNYNASFVQLDIQVGVLDAFRYMHFTQEDLARTANVRVRLSDSLTQSAAAPVLAVLAALQAADGDGYEFMRTLAVMQAIQTQPGELVSGGVAARVHTFFATFLQDAPAAIESANAAIALDAQNPLPYVLRSIANQRTGRVDNAVRDAETAARLGPDNWTVPLYLRAASLAGQEAINVYSQIIELRPDDWFPVNFRGALSYVTGQYDAAEADLQRSIDLGPNANFPYVFAAEIALRQGRVADAAGMYQVIVTRFPDPTLVMRLLEAAFGSQEGNTLGPLLSASVNLALGQYAEVVASTDAGLQLYTRLMRALGSSGRGSSPYNAQIADLYVLQGLAQCNSGDLTAAETAYGRAIALEPGYIFPRFLRGEVRWRQGNENTARVDWDAVGRSELNDAFAPLIEQVRAGDLTCETLLTVPE